MATTVFVHINATTTLKPTPARDGLTFEAPDGTSTTLFFPPEHILEYVQRLQHALAALARHSLTMEPVND